MPSQNSLLDLQGILNYTAHSLSPDDFSNFWQQFKKLWSALPEQGKDYYIGPGKTDFSTLYGKQLFRPIPGTRDIPYAVAPGTDDPMSEYYPISYPRRYINL